MFLFSKRSLTVTSELYHHQTSKHPFHLVDPSPWPLFTSLRALVTTIGGVLYMHSFAKGGYMLSLGLVSLVLITRFWWRDVTREGSFEGQHTVVVQDGLKSGMILFIVSEVMFFFAFFWAFFHSSLAPTHEIGGVWPPVGVEVLSPWEVPLLNTLILLLSGASVTWAHHSLILGAREQTIVSLIFTIGLAIIFTALQGFEYVNASFSINDSAYGSCFYLATGFHGAHVILGTLFLTVCLYRIWQGHLTREHHAGFEFAILYWHFVGAAVRLLFCYYLKYFFVKRL